MAFKIQKADKILLKFDVELLRESSYLEVERIKHCTLFVRDGVIMIGVHNESSEGSTLLSSSIQDVIAGKRDMRLKDPKLEKKLLEYIGLARL